MPSPPNAIAVVSDSTLTVRDDAAGAASELPYCFHTRVKMSKDHVSDLTEAVPMPPGPCPPWTKMLYPISHMAWKPRVVGESEIALS